MKKVIFSIFLGILILLSAKEVSAVSYSVYRDGSVTVDGYGMYLYTATVNGEGVMTYCIDAGRSYGQNGVYDQSYVIDPTSGKQFDIAVTRAYQTLQQMGLSSSSSTTNRVIGELVMRWLTERYNGRSCYSHLYGYCGPSLSSAKARFQRGPAGFSQSDSRVAVATQVFNDAIAVADSGRSYNELISLGYDNGGLWGPTFSTVNYTNTYATENMRRITFILQAGTDEVNTPEKFAEYAGGFTAGCTNTSVTCTVEQSTASYEPAGVLISMMVDTTNWDGQDFGIYVDALYCDSKSSTSQLVMLQKRGASAAQRMLIVMPGNCAASLAEPTSRPTSHRITITDDSDRETCSCDTSTGVYTYERYENGKLVAQESWTENSSNYQELMDKYKDTNNGQGCPNTCTVTPQPEKHVCEIVDDKHYCEDGEECSEEEYVKDCLCNPVVSIPSDCNDFDAESTANGYISDIATEDRNCNNSNVVDQIKQCVIDNTDATGESFEATNELNGNKYCKVWCSEAYDFELPTARYSTSGGYFTLTTSISGTRDCFVSSADNPDEPIDKELFNQDLEAAQHAVIDAYNVYSKWKSASSISSKPVTLTCSYSGRSCSAEESGCTSCSGGSKSNTGYTKTWNWIEYDYNGKDSEHSDSYGPGTSSDGTCSCSIDPEENRDSEHKRLYEEARTNLINAINNLNSVIAEFNSCTGVITNSANSDLATVDASSTSSSSWDNDMQFNPTVDFTYDQDYINQMSGEFEQINDTENSSYMYCSGDTNDKYECLSGETSSVSTEVRLIWTCDDGGCEQKPFNISTANWIRKSKTHDANYQVAENFSTYTQYGTIRVDDDPSTPDYLWTSLPDGALPVSLITETGVFPFKFTFGNIGQSNSIEGESGLGRLIDNNGSNSITVTDVLTEYNKLDDIFKCDGGTSSTVDGGYVCHYLNNCPGCDFTCDDENNCEFSDCEDGHCTLYCPNCVFDGDSTNYSYRTVSLNNMFPNDRDPGSNWNSEGSDKAAATLEEIASLGESIYETPQYSYTLTPTNLRNIREYNDEAGSYTNSKTPISLDGSDDSVYCDTVTYNGITYTVRCKSKFLDIIEDDQYRNVYVQSNSIIRNDEWTLYTEQFCPTGDCLRNGIGPSWK